MSKVAIQGNASGTGTFTIAAPNSNTDRTLTLPDEAGTVLTSASDITSQAMNGPAFSAYLSATQSITSTVYTKVEFNTENFDTDSCFDTSLYRFTPNVAGYYQINSSIRNSVGSGSISLSITSLYKNGSPIRLIDNRPSALILTNTLSEVVYMNGTTDYLEIYQRTDGTSPSVIGTALSSVFSGCLVRGA